MAVVSPNVVFHCDTAATAGNVNGGGFNPSNANFMTDGVIASGTGAAPTLSSVTYAFVAGDVGDWVFLAAGNGTGFFGWYKITSVTAGVATLNATIGQASVWSLAAMPSTIWKPVGGTAQVGAWVASTVQGCASTAAPTGVTFGVDYSQNPVTDLTLTDLVSAGGSTTITSVSALFTPAMVGNCLNINTSGTGAFGLVNQIFELVSYTNTSTMTTDRTTNNGTAMAAVTCKIGGAFSLGSSTNLTDTKVFQNGTGTNGTGASIFFVKNGTFSIQAIASLTVGGTQAPIMIIGFNAVRGDSCTGANRPIFAAAANAVTLTTDWDTYNLSFTTTAASGIAATGKIVNCKVVNNSTAAARTALGASIPINCEMVSYRGNAFVNGGGAAVDVYYNYIHDSNIGLSIGGAGGKKIIGNLIESCVANAISDGATTGFSIYIGNTLYGSVNKTGTGIAWTTGATNIFFFNNIVYGFATGVSHADTQFVGYDDYNDYFNNTTDVSKWQKGPNCVAVDPLFVNAAQVTGTAGKFRAGNDAIIDTTKNFTTLGVTAGQDFVYIVSGTGITAGQYKISSIATTTNPNDTLVLDLAPGTNTTADKTYQITIGHNFAVGPILHGKGFPGAFQGGLSTGYLDIGAVQRLGGVVFSPGMSGGVN